MMGLFMAVMAAVMLLSGAGIDRLNKQNAKSKQAQSTHITYAPESAGTSNEQNDAPAQESEVGQLAVPETEQDKLSEATEFWRNRLKVDRKGWLRHVDTGDATHDCRRVCDQTALLAGYDAAVELCGSRDANDPVGYYTYEKCANPSAAATTKAAAIERVDDEIASFAPVLAEKVEVVDGGYDTRLAFDVFKDELKERAKNSGWDLSSFLDVHMNGASNEHTICINSGRPGKCGSCYTQFRYDQTEIAAQNFSKVLNYLTAVSTDRGSCYWVNEIVPSLVATTVPFCEANKNFYGCQQFFDRLAECAAKKDEL